MMLQTSTANPRSVIVRRALCVGVISDAVSDNARARSCSVPRGVWNLGEGRRKEFCPGRRVARFGATFGRASLRFRPIERRCYREHRPGRGGVSGGLGGGWLRARGWTSQNGLVKRNRVSRRFCERFQCVTGQKWRCCGMLGSHNARNR